MKRSQISERRYRQKVLSLFLAVMMLSGIGFLPASKVQATDAGTTITSMSYFSGADGPVITKSGVGEASYGFVMPLFNGGSATWNDVAQDLGVKVKVNGGWVDIDSVGDFVYNQNWGHWNDGGFTGYWFTLSATTEIQLYSKPMGSRLNIHSSLNTSTKQPSRR